MRLQLIFCVESGKDDDSDMIYIREVLKHYYVGYDDADIKLNKIYLNGKFNYNRAKIIKKIKEYKKMFSLTNPDGITKVIYFFDTDNYDSNPDDNRFITEITSYCKENGYDYVWFCKDIECVFLGKKIPNNKKNDEAVRFMNNNMISAIKESCLKSKDYRINSSNILSVLSKYLERKG